MARYRYVTRTLQYRALQAPPAEPLALTKSHEQAKKNLHLSETPSNLDCGRIVQMVCDTFLWENLESRLHSFTIWPSPRIIHKEISTSVRQVADSQGVFPAAQPQLKSRNKQSPCDPSSGKWRPDNEHLHWMMLDDALQVMDIMWLWINTYENTIFLGGWTSIYNPAILMWTTGVPWVLTHCHVRAFQKNPQQQAFSENFEPSVPVCLRGAMSYNVVYIIIYLKIGKTYYSQLSTVY